MPTKKQIITFGVLCVIALGLGYWSGMPEEDSGQRAELVAPTVVTNVVTNVLKEVVTNIVVAPQPTPTPSPAIAKPQPSPKPNPITSANERLIGIADLIVEQAIRDRLSKPEGELNGADLTEVSDLNLTARKITDEGLKEVAKLYKLEQLIMTQCTKITDEGLKEVAKLQNLEELWLASTEITDEGLKEVAKLQNLIRLSLASTEITDEGLKEVAKLQKLTVLWLKETKITEAGVAELKKALPNCKIFSP